MNCVLRTRIVKSIFVKNIRCQNCPHCSVCEGKWSLFVKESGLCSCLWRKMAFLPVFCCSQLCLTPFLPALFHSSSPHLQNLLCGACKICNSAQVCSTFLCLFFRNCYVLIAKAAFFCWLYSTFLLSFCSGTAVWNLQILQFLPAEFHMSLPLLQELLSVAWKNWLLPPNSVQRYNSHFLILQELLCKACKNWLLPPSCVPHSSSSCSGTAM